MSDMSDPHKVLAELEILFLRVGANQFHPIHSKSHLHQIPDRHLLELLPEEEFDHQQESLELLFWREKEHAKHGTKNQHYHAWFQLGVEYQNRRC